MKNQIESFRESARRKEIVLGLLERMDVDIVAPDGSLPVVSVGRVGRLVSGAKIEISVPDSENCWLETEGDSRNVRYRTADEYGISPAEIVYVEKARNPTKHSMTERFYNFVIKLAGQRCSAEGRARQSLDSAGL